MSLTPNTWQAIMNEHPHLENFVETGTRYGDTALMMASGYFASDRVHTIELSEELFREAQPKFKGTSIHRYRGDSAVILPALTFVGATLYYLDAHWWANEEAASSESDPQGFPLWAELGHIIHIPPSTRGTDVIVVDDVHCFGRKTEMGMLTRWEGVTDVTLLEFMNSLMTPHVWTGKVYGDAFVMWRKDD